MKHRLQEEEIDSDPLEARDPGREPEEPDE